MFSWKFGNFSVQKARSSIVARFAIQTRLF
jgi:hypothetical protein